MISFVYKCCKYSCYSLLDSLEYSGYLVSGRSPGVVATYTRGAHASRERVPSLGAIIRFGSKRLYMY